MEIVGGPPHRADGLLELIAMRSSLSPVLEDILERLAGVIEPDDEIEQLVVAGGEGALMAPLAWLLALLFDDAGLPAFASAPRDT